MNYNFQGGRGNPSFKALPGGGGGGGTLIYSCIRRLESFLGVQNFAFQYFWWFSGKYIFWGMKILWIIFRVISKLDYI